MYPALRVYPVCVRFACVVSAMAWGHAAMSSPNTVEIAPGVHMPLVFLGTADDCFAENYTRIYERTRLGVSVGYTGFDTAYDPCYIDTAVAAGLKGVNRSSYFLTTKISGAGWLTYSSPNMTTYLLEKALANLATDYLDLVLIHIPGEFPNMTMAESLQGQWLAMEAFLRAGKTRAIGVSNFCPRALRAVLEVATVKPAVNQVLYHAGMGTDPDGVISLSRAHGITIAAYGASDSVNPVLLHGEPYRSIGAAHGKTGLQVAFRWLTQRGFPIIVASSSRTHQEQNLNSTDFELTPAEIANISAQVSCQAYGMKPPHCLPYYPSGCCNMYGNGTQCPRITAADFYRGEAGARVHDGPLSARDWSATATSDTTSRPAIYI